jgi:predicted TIM-barrel fold metal-dependent hydrolase
VTQLSYPVFDGDSHYYEAADAFIRHVPKAMRGRCMQWADVDGRRKLLVGGKVQQMIPNPLWDPVAKPGSLWAYFKGENPDGLDMKTLFGELEPLNPAYQDRDVRLALMDQQGVGRTMLFPTLGVLMETLLEDDPEACITAYHAFNQWVAEDWGFAYRDRIYSAGYLVLSDLDAAIAEVEWAIEQGVRVMNVRAAPVKNRQGAKSPADPIFDPVWARLQEADVLITTHLGAASRVFGERWEDKRPAGYAKPQSLHWILSHDRDVTDFVAAVICHGLFDRFPRLRLMSVENGAGWVAPLKGLLKKAHAQNPGYFSEDPIAIFDRHVWVTPFWEDPIDEVVATMPVDRISYGSDWPHAEGTFEPTSYAETIAHLDAETQRKILVDNTLAAIGLGPQAA